MADTPVLGYQPDAPQTPAQAVPTTPPQPAAPAQAAPTQAPQPSPAPSPAPAQGQPSQAVQTQPQPAAQSEATPQANRPVLDPRPYAKLAEEAPQYRAMIDQVAQETGVSPQRLAWHWYREGGFKTQVADGKAGEQGPLQVLPSTARTVDPKGTLDPHDLQSSLRLAGRYIGQMDAKFGQDTPASVMAYQGGPGSVQAMAANPARAEIDHPNTIAYGRAAFPGFQINGSHASKGIDIDPKNLVDANTQGGPDGALRYLSQVSQQSNMPMTDVMKSAESALVAQAAARGDIAGMQHAKDYFLQMSHAGANSNLMAAHQALSAGDSQSAAGYLAKAHAFFPDGSYGKFGIDAKGNLYGQRFDEHNPGNPLGQAFQVKPQDIAGMLNQTTDPNQYMKMVQEQEKSNADVRYRSNMGDYYADLNKTRQDIATHHDETSRANVGDNVAGREYGADARAGATVEAATIRANRTGTGPASKLSSQADKESEQYYGDLSGSTLSPEDRGARSETYHTLRTEEGMTPPSAKSVADALHENRLALVRQQDGTFAVVNPKDPKAQPVSVLSPQVGAKLAGGGNPQVQQGAVPGSGQQPKGGSPIGGAIGSATARAGGVTNDLSGTVTPDAQQQPSAALPTRG